MLPFAGGWPELKFAIAMDSASFHHSEGMNEMCRDVGVKQLYMGLYSPNFNLIEKFIQESFAELKRIVKRRTQ